MSAFSSGVSVQSTIGSRPIRALLVSHLFYLEENSLRWPINVINSVDNTKLHCVRSSSCPHILLWHPKAEASQPAGTRFAGGIQSSNRDQSASPIWCQNPEIAQHPDRSDTNSMHSPDVE